MSSCRQITGPTLTGQIIFDVDRHRYVWKTIEALSAKGWFAIDDYLWHKTNPMPGFWPTRLRDGWEYCFHLSKSARPYFNSDAVRRPIGDWVGARLSKLGQNDSTRQNSVNASGFGRNISKWVGKHTVLPSNVISLALVGKNRGHPAVFPVDLPLFFIKLLCPPDGLVVDPFAGSGTTGLAAISQNRRCLLIDNNATYCQIAQRRLSEEAVIPKSNGSYSETEISGNEQVKLLDAPSSKPLPKSKPVRYSISKRKK